MRGLIIKSISGEYTVISDNKQYVCKPRGTFRLNEQSPKVGDLVEFDFKTKTIMAILPRKNELIRPVVANIDKVFLIFSVTEPDLNLNLLDRLISIVEYNDIEIVIVFTKLDLLTDRQEFDKISEYYQKIGYKVYETGIGISLDLLKEEFPNHICVFAGQSGTGKSTLLNFFDPSFNLRTSEISYALNRGKHTTRHTELLPFNGGWIADTPGFGNIDFPFDDLLTYSHTFVEFFKNSNNCKFNRCIHLDEPNCWIKKLVNEGEILITRYNNYRLFAEEIKENIKNKY